MDFFTTEKHYAPLLATDVEEVVEEVKEKEAPVEEVVEEVKEKKEVKEEDK